MRATLGILGGLTLAAMWWGPLPDLARSAFFAHMALHMGVVAVAAPLLSLAIAGGRFDPVRKAPALFSPIPASLLELVVVWAWHAPGLHHMARHGALGLAAEQGMFLFCGLLLWLAAFGGDSPRNTGRAAAGIVGLLLTSMHMTLLGALLSLTPRPLYEHAHAHSTLSLSPLDDQHLGGAIMLLVGGVAYLIGGLWLTALVLRDRTREAGEQA